MRFVLTLSLLLASVANAQPVGVTVKPLLDTPAPPLADLSAILIGPSEVSPGSYVRVKITGTNGDDPKLIVVPAVKNMDLVTFSDGTYGVTAQLTEEGSYTFFLGVNKAGKTAIATLTVTVKQPEPPPVPDANVTKIKDALAADAPAPELKARLVSLYKQMAKEKVGTWKELAALLSKTADGMFKDNELTKTRAVISELLAEKLGSKNGPADPAIQANIFNGIADTVNAN